MRRDGTWQDITSIPTDPHKIFHSKSKIYVKLRFQALAGLTGDGDDGQPCRVDVWLVKCIRGRTFGLQIQVPWTHYNITHTRAITGGWRGFLAIITAMTVKDVMWCDGNSENQSSLKSLESNVVIGQSFQPNLDIIGCAICWACSDADDGRQDSPQLPNKLPPFPLTLTIEPWRWEWRLAPFSLHLPKSPNERGTQPLFQPTIPPWLAKIIDRLYLVNIPTVEGKRTTCV